MGSVELPGAWARSGRHRLYGQPAVAARTTAGTHRRALELRREADSPVAGRIARDLHTLERARRHAIADRRDEGGVELVGQVLTQDAQRILVLRIAEHNAAVQQPVSRLASQRRLVDVPIRE